jgi:hypothetical protein
VDETVGKLLVVPKLARRRLGTAWNTSQARAVAAIYFTRSPSVARAPPRPRQWHDVIPALLPRNAMAKNTPNKSAKVATPNKPAKKPAAKPIRAAKPRLLAGGNPQIAKGDGDAPVRAYIEAIPAGWKRDIARRLDALVKRTVPGVRKAVKWNSPFYGIEGGERHGGWFLSFLCFTKYVKVTFFRGTSLRPVPPGESKHNEVRYLDIHEGQWGKALDEEVVASWISQAAAMPGWVP